jgi:hypothetical protein
MRLNFDLPLLNKLSDGVIQINRMAKISGYNRAAEPWLKSCNAMLGVLKQLLDLEVRGRIKLPVKLGLWTSNNGNMATTGDAWLIMDGPNGYAIFIAPNASSTGDIDKLPPLSKSEIGFVNLLGDEARTQLSILQMLLPQADAQTLNSVELAVQCKRVDHLLQTLSELAQLLERDDVFADERLVLADLVRASFPSAHANPNHADFVFDAERSEPGMVYGNAPWLSYALRSLFDSIQHSAPPRSQINVAIQQMGNFAVLTARVAASQASSRARTLIAAPAPDAANAGTGLQHRDAQVRMLMCRRVIELHAGQLKLARLPAATDKADLAPIESFTLNLPTGLPSHQHGRASCALCPHILQEQAYASDLAQLLNQR